jgi:hypothetical protein
MGNRCEHPGEWQAASAISRFEPGRIRPCRSQTSPWSAWCQSRRAWFGRARVAYGTSPCRSGRAPMPSRLVSLSAGPVFLISLGGRRRALIHHGLAMMVLVTHRRRSRTTASRAPSSERSVGNGSRAESSATGIAMAQRVRNAPRRCQRPRVTSSTSWIRSGRRARSSARCGLTRAGRSGARSRPPDAVPARRASAKPCDRPSGGPIRATASRAVRFLSDRQRRSAKCTYFAAGGRPVGFSGCRRRAFSLRLLTRFADHRARGRRARPCRERRLPFRTRRRYP